MYMPSVMAKGEPPKCVSLRLEFQQRCAISMSTSRKSAEILRTRMLEPWNGDQRFSQR